MVCKNIKNNLDCFKETGCLKKGGRSCAITVNDYICDSGSEQYIIKDHKIDNKKDREKLLASFEIQQKLNHKNISSLCGWYSSGNDIFSIYKYNRGVDLSKFKGLTLNNINDILCQILQGLNYLHSNNIVHRDIKPENIIVYRNKNDTLNVKIIDLDDISIPKKSHSLFGTMYYLAPELIRHNIISQSNDIWAVGVMLYYMLTGSRILDNTYEIGNISDNYVEKNVLTNFKLPDKYVDILREMLKVDYTKRITASQLLRKLNC